MCLLKNKVPYTTTNHLNNLCQGEHYKPSENVFVLYQVSCNIILRILNSLFVSCFDDDENQTNHQFQIWIELRDLYGIIWFLIFFSYVFLIKHNYLSKSILLPYRSKRRWLTRAGAILIYGGGGNRQEIVTQDFVIYFVLS
jgi:hypothetical protein